MLPSAPDKCFFLSERENQVARARVERGVIVEKHGFNKRHFFESLKEPWTWWIGLIHFFGGAAFNS